ncbi:hypothetical protein AURDEDRAFT_171684 [Auricularia subglabra TFB-10046 SS5]|nr:hypothetical protein AURDEDRAFT_171684 [Auricularia subglabra TFB-10046 SS5]
MSNPFVASVRQLNEDPAASAFKKDEQVVGRPAVIPTERNLNDEGVRNPPNVRVDGHFLAVSGAPLIGSEQNLAEGVRVRSLGKEGAYETGQELQDEMSQRDLPEAGVGRLIKEPFQAYDAESTSIHPNNPPK